MNKHLETNLSFYDSIASDYNSLLTETDAKFRKIVEKIFTENILKGPVLDFGGGTGLDLPWLINSYCQIFFIEPSSRMRMIAKKAMEGLDGSDRVIVVEKGTNFESWSKETLPFTEEIKGILLNFAVLNCISNIHLFFERMALVTTPGSHIVVTIIDSRFSNIIKCYSAFAAVKMLVQGKLKVLNRHKEVYHETYVHSVKSIKTAASRHFLFKNSQQMEAGGFVVLIFVKR